jgi:hypothetical protein
MSSKNQEEVLFEDIENLLEKYDLDPTLYAAAFSGLDEEGNIVTFCVHEKITASALGAMGAFAKYHVLSSAKPASLNFSWDLQELCRIYSFLGATIVTFKKSDHHIKDKALYCDSSGTKFIRILTASMIEKTAIKNSSVVEKEQEKKVDVNNLFKYEMHKH